MILSLVACGKDTGTGNAGNAGQSAGQSSAQTANNTQSNSSETAGNQSSDQLIVPAKLTGKLNIIDLKDRDPSILRGIRIYGNRIGSSEDINGKEASLDDVRDIFELNEWVEFYPDADKEYGLRVWVFEHRDDHEFYKTCAFSDLTPGFATYCDLHYPVDEENPEEWAWGSFYMLPEDHPAGYYDFVFTYDGKAIATLVTRFYKDEGELSSKSGAELEKLMHE